MAITEIDHMRRRSIGCYWMFAVAVTTAFAGCGAESTEPTSTAASQPGTSVEEPTEYLPTGELLLENSTPIAQALSAKDAKFDDSYPVVAIETSQGTVEVKLDAIKSPITVRNFLWAADNGSYNGTIFHQVESEFIAVGGEYDVEMKRRTPVATIRNEANNGLLNKRFTIAMTRDPSVIDSSTGPFFFNLADNPHLDHEGKEEAEKFGFCVFGSVSAGTEVLERIGGSAVAARGDLAMVPVEPIVIQAIRRLR